MKYEKVCYNLGGGPKKIKGFKNVDVLAWKIDDDLPGITDILWDLNKVPYEFAEENSVDELMATNLLEYIQFRNTTKVLKEWYSILKPGGILQIQVSDCGKMMECFVNNKICECVPDRETRNDKFKSKTGCWDCGGKAIVNYSRWLFSFIGAQKHPYDTCKNIFTKDTLEANLREVGFKKVEFKNNIYKLVVVCTK